MAATLTVTDHWTDGKRIHIIGTIATSGNYATGGVALALNDFKIKSPSPPEWVSIQGQGLNAYSWIPGTTQLNGKIFGSTAGVQFTNGAAWPADTLTIYAIFPKYI